MKGLGAECLRLLQFASVFTFGRCISLTEDQRVARGFDCLNAAPYSPISDFGSNSSANHQLSIFTSSCFSDVETIFSTAEKHEDRDEDILFFIKELSWNEHRRHKPSAQIFLSQHLFYFPQHDIRLKESIKFCPERNEWVTSVEYTGIL